MKFTDKGIQSLKPETKRYEIYSDDKSGFGIRVSPSGVKSWISRYRRNGELIKLTLGNYPALPLSEARIKHNDIRKLIHDGKDPRQLIQAQRQSEHEAGTVSELVHEFIERHSKIKKKSWAEDKRILDKDVIPNWGKRKVKDITRRDIVRLLDTVVDRGSPSSANNLHARLSKMFRFAVKRGIIDTSPFVEIEIPAEKTRRDRVLDAREIKIFWQKLDDAATHDSIKLALEFLLVTAQRRGEVAQAKKSEFDVENASWVIPAERTKNGLRHYVPLSPLAVELLEQMIALSGDSEYLVPSPHQQEDKPIRAQAISRAVRNNDDHFGLERFTPHDLRRTAATMMTGVCKIPRFLVSKVLNHVEPGRNKSTEVYDCYEYAEEKREALNKWALILGNII